MQNEPDSARPPRDDPGTQLFPRWANLAARLALVGLVLLPLGVIGLLLALPYTPYVTSQGLAPAQPVPFSHEHHVGGLGLDCRYCHTSVETSRFAGLPPTHTCMTCHSQLWTNAAMLAPVRRSLAEGQPIRWRRVHRAARLRLFRPQHPCGEGRRLHHLPRAGGPDAADAAGGAADHGLVPRLPPRPARRTCGPEREIFAGHWRRRRTSGRAARQLIAPLRHPHRAPDRLLGLPPVSDGRALPPPGGAGAASPRRWPAASPAADQPEEEILPYVEQPERLVPGVPLRFATALPLNGYARGVLCTSHEGRPIKLEGNPAHPASLGATDVFAEAELMQLYDPDRSRGPRQAGRASRPGRASSPHSCRGWRAAARGARGCGCSPARSPRPPCCG